MIQEALKSFKGNRTKAARSLGLSRRGFYKKLSRYDFEKHKAGLSS